MAEEATKERILEELLSGRRVSGQALADAAGISRTAVWKHVSGLRELGFDILAEAGQGYRLLSAPDSLHPLNVRPGLGTRFLGGSLHYREETASTQDRARALAGQGATEGTAILAERQIRGRGRRDRQWQSLSGAVALSVIFRPRLSPERIPQFSLLAGAAAAGALADLTGLEPGLKWPNDVLINGRKVAGILAEMASDAEKIDYVLLGMGINVNTPSEEIPLEIRETASSVLAETGWEISRPALVRALLYRLEDLYLQLCDRGFAPIREQWLSRNQTLGRRIRADTGTAVLEGTAEDIDETGCLLLREESGAGTRLLSGDVSIRS